MSIAPLHAVLTDVMEGVGSPALILRPQQEVHGTHLAPSQAAIAHTADVVFLIDPAMEAPIARLAGDRAVALGSVPSLPHLSTRTAHEDEDEHTPLGSPDPHVWLDPIGMAIMAEAAADTLARKDPAHADVYRGNAARARLQLEALDAAFRQSFANATARKDVLPYLSLHDATQYLEHRYDLPRPLFLATDHHGGASAGALESLLRDIGSRPLRCILVEPGAPSALATRLAARTHARLVAIDPHGRTMQGKGIDAYARMMKDIAARLQPCLSAAKTLPMPRDN